MREVVFPLLCWVQGLSFLRESFIFLFHHISQENFLKQKYLKDFLGQVKGGSCPLPPRQLRPCLLSTTVPINTNNILLDQLLPTTIPAPTINVSLDLNFQNIISYPRRWSHKYSHANKRSRQRTYIFSCVVMQHTQSIKFSTSTLVLATCHLHDKLYFPQSYTSPTSSVDWAHLSLRPWNFPTLLFFSIDSNFEAYFPI